MAGQTGVLDCTNGRFHNTLFLTRNNRDPHHILSCAPWKVTVIRRAINAEPPTRTLRDKALHAIRDGGHEAAAHAKSKSLATTLFAALLGLALAPCLAVAQPAAQRPVAAEGEIQDLIYLAPGHPVFIRIHLQVNGKGFRAMQLERANRLFKSLDRNKDGYLNTSESKEIPIPR